MDVERVKQEYSLKTDDELLALVVDSGSLADEARPLLAEEIRRRNLGDKAADVGGLRNAISSSSGGTIWLRRAKWAGLWVLNTLNATLGVGVAVGVINYSIRPFAGHAIRLYLMQGPSYPLPIIVASLAGYFTYRSIRGSYCYWAWVVPAVSMTIAMAHWKASNQASWLAALDHFFLRRLPYPDASVQLGTTGVLLMSLTYSLAALVRAAPSNFDSPGRSDSKATAD